MESLRSKLEEATGDIVALRKQLQKKEANESVGGNRNISAAFSHTNNDYEQLVQELEKIKKKVCMYVIEYT